MIQYAVYAGVGGLLIGALSSGVMVSKYVNARWSAEVSLLKIDAANQLQIATVKAMDIEHEAQIKVREVEAQYVKTENDLELIEQRNRKLAAELGGLRDPGRRANRPHPLPTTPSSALCPTDPTDPSLLSAETTTILLDAAAEADALYNYANTGHEYAKSIEEMRNAE